MKIELKNDFHATTVNVVVPALPCSLSVNQTWRVRDELCGVSGCTCGKLRGPQSVDVSQEGDGRYVLAAKGDS